MLHGCMGRSTKSILYRIIRVILLSFFHRVSFSNRCELFLLFDLPISLNHEDIASACCSIPFLQTSMVNLLLLWLHNLKFSADADVRLARRIRRDTVEKNRDIATVLDQVSWALHEYWKNLWAYFAISYVPSLLYFLLLLVDLLSRYQFLFCIPNVQQNAICY